jgi:hypothetical protein
MATVTLSSALKRFCGSVGTLTGTGRTVLEVILDSTRNYPELRRKLLKSDNEIHSQILVYLNSCILAKPREQALVDADAELNLLLIVGGG